MNFNVITSILIAVFIIPILLGMFSRFSRERIRYSLDSFLSNIEFLLGVWLSIEITRRVFFENRDDFFHQLNSMIPQSVLFALQGRDMMVYLICVPLLLVILMTILRLVMIPVYRFIILPLADSLFDLLAAMKPAARSIIGGISQLPKAVFLVVILSLGLNFYAYYFPSLQVAQWMNESKPYQFLYRNAVTPVLNSNIAKQIPVLVNDSFKSIGNITPEGDNAGSRDLPEKIAETLKGKIRVIEYFNGVTLDEAIKSTPEIDQTAMGIVGDETDGNKKAYLIYRWISKNIKYDYEKAKKITNNATGLSSGSIEAFTTRTGICFDYSCLYVSMCRAVGVKVRLVTGLAYSGISWGDHSWNQVYDDKQNRWINVDCTFGAVSDYFDKPDFSVDHRYDEVQGEWVS